MEEFTSGATLWVGGEEAIDRALHGSNDLRVDIVLDARGAFPLRRDKSPHLIRPQGAVRHKPISQTKLGRRVVAPLFERLVQPAIEELRQPQRVLVACINGRHRSAQLAALLLLGGLPPAAAGDAASVEQALAHVWARRHLVEWTHLSGPSPNAPVFGQNFRRVWTRCLLQGPSALAACPPVGPLRPPCSA